MLQQGPLPPSRAAWLAREVAEAIAAGHAQGVAHGRLNPEAVLVTHAGAVKLIGYVVDASPRAPAAARPALRRARRARGRRDQPRRHPLRRADRPLAGRGPSPRVPTAPREARRPLRPRQVRAGVPRTLDAICERVLHKEASLPRDADRDRPRDRGGAGRLRRRPGAVRPRSTLPAMHAEPTVPVHRDALTAAPRTADPDAGPDRRGSDPQATRRPTRGGRGAHRRGGRRARPGPRGRPGSTQAATRRRRAHRAARRAAAEERHPAPPRPRTVRRRLHQRPPPPPFEEPPERPAVRRHRAPRPAASGRRHAPGRPGRDGHRGGGASAQGLGTDPRLAETPSGGDVRLRLLAVRRGPRSRRAPHTGKEGRGWLRMAIVVGVLLVRGGRHGRRLQPRPRGRHRPAPAAARRPPAPRPPRRPRARR